jgi:hypothetical protein
VERLHRNLRHLDLLYRQLRLDLQQVHQLQQDRPVRQDRQALRVHQLLRQVHHDPRQGQHRTHHL